MDTNDLRQLPIRDQIIFWGFAILGGVPVAFAFYFFFIAGDHAVGVGLLALWVGLQAWARVDD